MGKFELTIAENYVADWGVVEAIRELFQNARDQEVQQEDNTMFFNYNENTGILEIGNKLSVLEKNTLLLGQTTKADSEDTIGQFGEGYKVATLVLLRNDKKITFFNYGNKEIWKPRFVNSRRYNAKILTFEVEKQHIWNPVPHNNLVIKVENITKEEFDKIKDANLYFHEVNEDDTHITKYGRILLEEKYKGKIYVNGLFVSEVSELSHGYDVKPNHLKLDRDRRAVGSFDAQWLTSKMWSEVENTDVVDLIVSGCKDVQYINNHIYKNDISEGVVDSFIEEYGEYAIPVTSQSELKAVNEEYIDAKPVIVPEVVKDVLKSNSHETKATLKIETINGSEATVKELISWGELNRWSLNSGEYDKFLVLMDKIKAELFL